MTAHTPASLLALAREAAKWNKVFTNPPSEAERAWYRLLYECDPALIVALVERLADIEGCHNCYSCNYDGKDPLEVPLIQSPADHE